MSCSLFWRFITAFLESPQRQMSDTAASRATRKSCWVSGQRIFDSWQNRYPWPPSTGRGSCWSQSGLLQHLIPGLFCLYVILAYSVHLRRRSLVRLNSSLLPARRLKIRILAPSWTSLACLPSFYTEQSAFCWRSPSNSGYSAGMIWTKSLDLTYRLEFTYRISRNWYVAQHGSCFPFCARRMLGRGVSHTD